MSAWVPTIGLEVHVQLGTATKLFCGCATTFGAPPNTQVCAICAGLPGTLPQPNRQAFALAIRAGLALDCEIAAGTAFDRKHYTYPDLPKGFQTTQLDAPICGPGALPVVTADGGALTMRLRRAHLEEDAGKLIHDRHPEATAVDLNRCGVPLIEIVTEPDGTQPELVEAWLRELRRTLVAAGVSECDMEKGSLRCDANVSIHQAGHPLGERVEIKNLNSFRNVRRALQHEIARQSAERDAGRTIARETRLYDAARDVTRVMRAKEAQQDYRYAPEPDLPPLRIDPAWVAAIRAQLPELPRARRDRLVREFGLSATDVAVLTEEPATADLLEATVAALGDPRLAATWIQGDVLALAKGHAEGVAALAFDGAGLAELLRHVADGSLSGSQAKAVLAEMGETGRAANAIIAAAGVRQESDPVVLARLVAQAVAAYPGVVDDYRAGKREKAVGFLMGQVMRASNGQANPQRARAELERVLASA